MPTILRRALDFHESACDEAVKLLSSRYRHDGYSYKRLVQIGSVY